MPLSLTPPLADQTTTPTNHIALHHIDSIDNDSYRQAKDSLDSTATGTHYVLRSSTVLLQDKAAPFPVQQLSPTNITQQCRTIYQQTRETFPSSPKTEAMSQEQRTAHINPHASTFNDLTSKHNNFMKFITGIE